MSDIKTLIKQIIAFRDERDWKQFHTPKDVALSIVLEASEVMEHFQWKNEQEIKEHIRKHKKDIGDELADTLFYLLLLSHDLDIDITDAFAKKLKKTAAKYPVATSKGSHKKYTEL